MGAFNQLADRWRHRLLGLVFDDFASHLQRVGVSYKDVKVTSSQLDTGNASPIELVPAPGAGKVLEFLGAFAFLDAGATPFELGSGTGDIRYENGSGGKVGELTNAFLESAADAYFKAVPSAAVALANKALVLHPSADVTAGNGDLYLRVYYRTVTVVEVNPTVL